jgi:hypothetical protein
LPGEADIPVCGQTGIIRQFPHCGDTKCCRERQQEYIPPHYLHTYHSNCDLREKKLDKDREESFRHRLHKGPVK